MNEGPAVKSEPRHIGELLREGEPESSGDLLASARMKVQADPARYLSTAGVPLLYLRARTADFAAELPTPNASGLFICGAPGVGKTHAAVALLARLAPDHLRVRRGQAFPDAAWRAVPELIAQVKNTFDRENRPFHHIEDAEDFPRDEAGIIRELTSIGLLILDDLAAERWTDWSLALLTRVVNQRINFMKPTIVTSNLTLLELYTLDARLASRLGGMEYLKLTGADRRLQKTRQED